MTSSRSRCKKIIFNLRAIRNEYEVFPTGSYERARKIRVLVVEIRVFMTLLCLIQRGAR